MVLQLIICYEYLCGNRDGEQTYPRVLTSFVLNGLAEMILDTVRPSFE